MAAAVPGSHAWRCGCIHSISTGAVGTGVSGTKEVGKRVSAYTSQRACRASSPRRVWPARGHVPTQGRSPAEVLYLPARCTRVCRGAVGSKGGGEGRGGKGEASKGGGGAGRVPHSRLHRSALRQCQQQAPIHHALPRGELMWSKAQAAATGVSPRHPCALAAHQETAGAGHAHRGPALAVQGAPRQGTQQGLGTRRARQGWWG